jgi:hypothetical protein
MSRSYKVPMTRCCTQKDTVAAKLRALEHGCERAALRRAIHDALSTGNLEDITPSFVPDGYLIGDGKLYGRPSTDPRDSRK